MLFDDDPGPDSNDEVTEDDLIRRRDERNRNTREPAADILEAVRRAAARCGSTDPHRVRAQLKFDSAEPPAGTGVEFPISLVEKALTALQRAGRLRR